ncbi:cell division protein FtsL [Ferrimonas balearica]|uniref:cell division protein FtsL n=1 Tax=Ferrimonas balearica TaxID=44012 RepID=UPI001C9919E3|nr:cell division protein FtsL [Ferrimonas balearica]MBY5992113.1 cell division protein FtsL [Ferrimonas balearica]
MTTNLARIIGMDLWHHKWLVALALCVLASAMGVVWSAQESRNLTARWNELLQERDQLDVQWRHLLLEEQTLAEHSRVARKATRDLQMHRPKPSQEKVVRLP